MDNEEFEKLLSLKHPKFNPRLDSVTTLSLNCLFPNGKSYAEISNLKCQKGHEKEYLLLANGKANEGDYDSMAFIGLYLQGSPLKEISILAMEYFQKGYKVHHPACGYLLSLFYERLGYHDLRLSLIKEYLDYQEDLGLSTLLDSLFRENKLDEAYECLTKWESFRPNDKGILSYFASYYLKVGDYQNAYKVLMKDEGNQRARIGKMLLYGYGLDTKKDARKGLLSLRKASGSKSTLPDQDPVYPECELAYAFYYGIGVKRSIPLSDFHSKRALNAYWSLLNHYPEFGDFLASNGFYDRYKAKADALIKEAKESPYKYLRAADMLSGPYLNKPYRVRECLEEACAAEVFEAYQKLGALDDKDDRKRRPRSKKAPPNGWLDKGIARLSKAESKEELGLMLDELSDKEIIDFLPDILGKMLLYPQEDGFRRVVHLVNSIPLLDFLDYDIRKANDLFDDRFALLLEEGEMKRFYGRLILICHTQDIESIGKKLGLDVDNLFLTELTLKKGDI